jgi:nicotinamide-nucleotide adenylyltransferase
MVSTALLAQLVQRVQQRASSFEFAHKAQALWPLPNSNAASHPAPLKIAVLDSSFNPPTRAHLALATYPYASASQTIDTSPCHYDALLLLLSVRNADKTLKPADATYPQRVEMMVQFGNHLKSVEGSSNFAVGIIDEPTFIGKANILRPLLTDVHAAFGIGRVGIELTFLVGMDTLERLFAPRYYGSEEAMRVATKKFLSVEELGCRVACARRTMSEVDQIEQERKAVEEAREFIDAGRVVLIDIGERERTMSSSEARGLRSKGDDSWVDLVPSAVAEIITRDGLYREDV